MVKWILLSISLFSFIPNVIEKLASAQNQFLNQVGYTEAEWKKHLGEERYRVMRLKEREKAFFGKYVYTTQNGIYHCAACESPLFSSKDKYLSGSGWPSFTQPIQREAVYFLEDLRPPFKRYEVLCKSCHSHLGHIFPDGPPPRHKRYAIQSISLIFRED